MRSKLFSALLLTTLSLVVGCGSCFSTEIDANDYDRDCAQDEDCAIVTEGDVCFCGSPAAINRRELERYQRDSRDADNYCSARASCAPPLEQAIPECRARRCEVRFEPYPSPGDATP